MTRFLSVLTATLMTALPATAFELQSADFAADGAIPMAHVANVFGCTGGDASPALNWTGTPEGTASFALLVHDPDAPTGGAGFWHWLVLDIPGSATGLDQGAGAADGAALPEGARMLPNDFGVPAWGGPCPPEGHGPHHYNFTLYALPEGVAVPEGATKAVAGFIVNASALAKATLTGTFER